MSSLITSGQHLELRKWEPSQDTPGDHPWEYASRVNKTDKANPIRDDSVVVAPIFYKSIPTKKGKIRQEAQIGLSLAYRPPLDGKPSKGLHWEVVGGLNKDSASIRSTPENAQKELKEETNFKLRDLHSKKAFKGLASSGGMTDETHSIMTAECEAPEKDHQIITPDVVTLKLVSLPLKDAFTFLKEQANQGYNVSLTSIAAIFNALSDLKVMPDFNKKRRPIQAKEIWNAGKQLNLIKTKFQECGLQKIEDLKRNINQRRSKTPAL